MMVQVDSARRWAARRRAGRPASAGAGPGLGATPVLGGRGGQPGSRRSQGTRGRCHRGVWRRTVLLSLPAALATAIPTRPGAGLRTRLQSLPAGPGLAGGL